MANERARQLRREATFAERLLWPKLRALKPLGLHFRRQEPIGNYIVDFACRSARLVIEIDGSQHGLPNQQARDEERTAFLHNRGYLVLRFWNAEVMRNTVGVAEAIYREAKHNLEREAKK